MFAARNGSIEVSRMLLAAGEKIDHVDGMTVEEAEHQIATRLYQTVLEAKASEESSRMVAMKNATENAEELIEDLTLSYNKVRQANITREMIEIASGAQAR